MILHFFGLLLQFSNLKGMHQKKACSVRMLSILWMRNLSAVLYGGRHGNCQDNIKSFFPMSSAHSCWRLPNNMFILEQWKKWLKMETKWTNLMKSLKMRSVISFDMFVVLVYDLFSRWLDSRRMYAAVVDGGSLPAKHLTRPGYIFVFSFTDFLV